MDDMRPRYVPRRAKGTRWRGRRPGRTVVSERNHCGKSLEYCGDEAMSRA